MINAKPIINVKALVMDFDGVFTDNRVLVQSDGSESIWCSRSDGMGITLLHREGLPMVVLSSEKDPVCTHRCRKLKLECHHALDDKAAAMQQWLDEKGIAASDTIYIGNDVNDLPCMKLAGMSVAVADAHLSAMTEADLVLENRGGHGALRELADMILASMNEVS